MSFLSELAAEIVSPQNIDYRNVAVVLPNKRAQKALDAELAHAAGRGIFPPVVFSIDEFVASLSGLEVLPMTELLVELYGVYGKVAAAHRTETDDFQKFMSWGVNLIGDFNDIDRQLADARQVYSYLTDFKNIGIEIGSDGQPTAGQRRYLEFYGMLYEIYVGFGETLRLKGKAYPGLVYRIAAENISELSETQIFTKYFFAGLNAMTPAESRIIHHLYQQGKVQFFFDFDPFYLEYTAQIRKELADKFRIEEKDIHRIANHYGSAPKYVRTYGVSKTMNQVYEAVEILNRIENENPEALNHTAVVFADESLIVPFVHAYDSAKCNISKKYPARGTAAYRLLQILLGMALNYQRLRHDGDGDGDKAAYYHTDVLSLYQDPLVAAAFCPDQGEHHVFVRSLVRSNQLFFSRRILDERLPGSCPDVTGSGDGLVRAISAYFNLVADRLPDDFSTDRRLLRLFADAMDDAAEVLGRCNCMGAVEVRTAEFFINEKIDLLDLSFRGERSSGVQVMGLLETRALDFDHVVMLSVNEGVLPSGNCDNSLILFEIKKIFNLSTYEQNDAIYGYHFFHLLQRASDIHLIYNADSSDEVAEESRFIKQIFFKKKKLGLENLVFEQVVLPPRASGGGDVRQPLAIANTEKTREFLEKFHFSASSLNTYINCPLQFYLKFVAGIFPEEEIDENVEQSIIGLVVHKALEQLGNAMIADPGIPPAVLVDEWMEKVEGNYIFELFDLFDDVKGQDYSRGRLYLAAEVIRRTLKAYLPKLKEELASGESRIIGCERRFSCTLDVGGTVVALKGFADRIDLHGSKVAILDYKSGQSYSTAFKTVNDLFTNTGKKHIFQLFFYMLLYKYRNKKDFPSDRFPDTMPEAGIVYLCDALQGKNPTHFANQQYTKKEKAALAKAGEEPATPEQLLQEFEDSLKVFIKDLLETEKFVQTPNLNHCQFCDYSQICQRQVQRYSVL